MTLTHQPSLDEIRGNMKTELQPHSPEWYEAYRNRQIDLLTTASPVPHGRTEFEPMDKGSAEIIASHFYDVEAIARQDSGAWAVRTRGGWSAIVGNVKGVPAILHKENMGTLTLNTLAVNW